MSMSLNPKLNDEYIDRLKAVECADSTFPARNPALVFAEALGSQIWDVAGRCYLDFCAGFGVLALGHNSAATSSVLAARQKAIETSGRPPISHGMGDVYPSRAKIELLEKLTGILPASLKTAALALSGSQAVEIAVKSALLRQKKSGIICFEGSYHGLDLGLLPLASRADFREPFEGWQDGHAVRRVAFRCGEAELLKAIHDLNQSSDGAAAVIVEPVQGRSGAKPAGIEWLKLLRRVCDEHGLLLIYDEVFTGLGRSGRLTFAEEVPCDLLCLGKALGGGLPLSACVGTKDAMSGWPESQGEAIHTGTFFGHPLACETGLATLNEMMSANLPRQARDVGAKALALLREKLGHASAIKEIRGEGMMLAIEFSEPGAGALCMDQLRAEGIVALASGLQGESISFTPALNMPFEYWQLLIDALLRTKLIIG